VAATKGVTVCNRAPGAVIGIGEEGCPDKTRVTIRGFSQDKCYNTHK